MLGVWSCYCSSDQTGIKVIKLAFACTGVYVWTAEQERCPVLARKVRQADLLFVFVDRPEYINALV